jgi:hypothetical protein
MENIVCLGTPACNIGRMLEKYNQYKVYCIDDEGRRRKAFYKMPKEDTPEKYEENYDSEIDKFLAPVKKTVTLFVCGASLISGSTLRMLQSLTTRCKKIEIVYIKPETSLLSETKKLQERVVYNILQQYTRSGVFSKMYLVSNESISSFLPDVPLVEHYSKINEIIVSTYHMINIFNNSKSVVDTFSTPRPTSRICTLLVFDPAAATEEKMFFSLENSTEVRYYYGIPDENLKEEKDLYRKILNQMKKRLDIFSKVSYGIYETGYEKKIGYGVAYTNIIQATNEVEREPTPPQL